MTRRLFVSTAVMQALMRNKTVSAGRRRIGLVILREVAGSPPGETLPTRGSCDFAQDDRLALRVCSRTPGTFMGVGCSEDQRLSHGGEAA